MPNRKRHKARKTQSRGGHFCWCCGRVRANERFSGRGHARHLCRNCHQLGPEELAYRQAVRDIDRLVTFESGLIRRKQRAVFARYLEHRNPRVRRYAEEVAAFDREQRDLARIEQRIEDILEEAQARFWEIANEEGAEIITVREPPACDDDDAECRMFLDWLVL